MSAGTKSGNVGPDSAKEWVSPITRSSIVYLVGSLSSSDAPSSHYIDPPNGTSQGKFLESVRYLHCPQCRRPFGCDVLGQS
jgi:hypothetical protein